VKQFYFHRNIRSFVIRDEGIEGIEGIEVEIVEKFLSFVHCGNSRTFFCDDARSFLSLCRLFGKERLFVLFLASIGSNSTGTRVEGSTIEFVQMTLMDVHHNFTDIQMKIFE
jgi:hypothetical protein